MDADDELQVLLEDCRNVGHSWRTVEIVAARDGAYVERACTRCGTSTMVGPDELGGWV